MNRVRSIFFATLIACTFSFTVASGQVTTGVIPFGSFSGGAFDTVNNANLDVHFQIPVVSKAGRGLPFHYILSYDNSVWSPLSASGSTAWTPALNWGWTNLSEGLPGQITYKIMTDKCMVRSGGLTGWYPYPYYIFGPYVDSANVSHNAIAMTTPGSTQCGVQPIESATSTATEGSGYTVVVTDLLSATVYTRSGVNLNPPLSVSTSFNSVVTDTNGNQITSSTSSGTTTYTDTLATTALTVSGSGTPSSPVTLTYTGGTGAVTVNYTSYTVQTNFGCSGIPEYGATAQNLVSSINLPDNTSYTFTYETTPGDTNNPHHVTGRLASITLPTGGTITYAYSGGSNGITCDDGITATLTRTTPDGTWTYTHTESGAAWLTTITDPQSNETVLHSQGVYETERQVYQGSSSSGTLLETAYTCYNGAGYPCNSTSITLPITQRTVNTILAGLSASEVSTTYKTVGLPLETDEYDYGASTATRKTLISYANLSNAYIQDRPSSIQVENGSGALTGQTSYGYDGNGNLTSETRYSTPSTTISRSFTYNNNGTLATSTDFNSHQTTYTYGACDSSFPTTVTGPLLYANLTWDCNGGVIASIENANSNKTQFSYDNLWRLATVSYPDGGGSTISYTGATEQDVLTNVVGSTQRHDQTLLDGLGRVKQTSLVNDPDGQPYVATTYNSLGQIYTVSNPYRTTSDSTYGLTTYGYDALGRVTSVIAPGNYGTTSISYPSNCTIVTDPQSHLQETCSDALGRIISAHLDPSHLNFFTTYTYDTLNNLAGVSQNGQTRTYNYDWLSRLTSSYTPEVSIGTTTPTQCPTTYAYDANSNLTSMAAPAPNQNASCSSTVTTTYAYDALNRLTGKTYSDGTTPPVTYSYDQASYNGLAITNGAGQRTGMSDGSGQTAWSYDSMGRVLAEQRTISGVTKAISYSYNLDGSVASVTYPSGRAVSYTASVTGGPTAAQDTVNNINYAQYLTSPMYAPQGALANALYGESGTFGGISFAAAYNPLLVPQSLQAASSGGTAMNLGYSFYGNLNVSTITNNRDTGRNLTYTYDNLNRLATAQSAAASGTDCWGQSFGYDDANKWGNLTTIGVSKCSAPALSVSVNSANHITTSGFSYDAAGNMLANNLLSYAWNAENQLTSTAGVTYTYDGDGQRVMKSSGTLYWRGADGSILAETDTSGNTTREYIYFSNGQIAWRDASGNVYYLFQDYLGSTQTMTTANGTLCYDADRYPFGGELTFTSTCLQDYTFAGMESDTESGDYHAWFRQQTPNLGRWTSPDLLGGDVTNPLSLNRYAYVTNNPTRLTDPLGLYPIYPAPPPDCDPDIGCVSGGVGDPGGGCSEGGPGCPSPSPPANCFFDFCFEGGGGSGGGGGGTTTTTTPSIWPTNGNADFPDGTTVCAVIDGVAYPCTSTTDPLGSGPGWWADFFGDLFSLSSFLAAQQGAWNKGYYGCIVNQMFGTTFSPGNTHLASDLANAAIQNTSLPERATGVWYHFTDARFTAWGKFSKVLVPRATKAIRVAAEGANGATWAVTDVELVKAVSTCAGTL
jgi:RHS repeat-associated protein